MTFGERLRELRQEKGLSLNAMAKAVGMTPPGYLRLEDGTVGKGFEKLPIIAKKLGCSIDRLFPEMDAARTRVRQIRRRVLRGARYASVERRRA